MDVVAECKVQQAGWDNAVRAMAATKLQAPHLQVHRRTGHVPPEPLTHLVYKLEVGRVTSCAARLVLQWLDVSHHPPELACEEGGAFFIRI